MKLFLTSVIVLMSVGCGKPEPVEPPTPPPTTTGANIMVYKVNGSLRVYKGAPNTVNSEGVFCKVSWGAPDSTIYIHAVPSGKDYSDQLTIFLYTADIDTGKEYILSGNTSTSKPENYGEYRTGFLYGKDVYRAHINSGYVKFSRFDSEVAAGHFTFVAFNPNEDKKEITEGYFDIKK